MPSNSSHSNEEDEDKPCRACTDFKSWAKKTKASLPSNKQTQQPEEPQRPDDCPLDKSELGRSTWGFLHSMASYYPDKPTCQQADNMTKFFDIFTQFYPCEPCAIDFKKDIEQNPPKTSSQSELSRWLCERHNVVNLKLGKPKFDCNQVNDRWRDGWPDGSCD